VILTVGHSTHTADAFLELLRTHDVRRLADVRTVPRSARHPQFNRDRLGDLLPLHAISYRHFPELGGFRRPRADSTNTGWRDHNFRGYADYMQTPAFHTGVDELLRFSGEQPTAVMCAEAVWWRCHRRLLADALVARGVPVLHILSGSAPKPHELSDFARVVGHTVTYPGLL
jgi:uncharacterized protein (DUF488 family)